ncbi:rhodanese-like domain-containing protein [Verrucomicrobium spinosum]|nr:rhodanese-like domain-containing protein [Verrucomicrobium spinosum]
MLPATARYVSVAEARELLKGGKLGGIVDVRTPEEVTDSNHLPGARFVNLFVSNFDQSILNLGLDRTRPCLVYCALGGRAARTAARLDALGFKDVLVLQGGYEAWHRQSGELGP